MFENNVGEIKNNCTLNNSFIIKQKGKATKVVLL